MTPFAAEETPRREETQRRVEARPAAARVPTQTGEAAAAGPAVRPTRRLPEAAVAESNRLEAEAEDLRHRNRENHEGEKPRFGHVVHLLSEP
jgi:hypothetical protein